MTRPRATTSPSDALGATIADLKARLARLENIAHQHRVLGSHLGLQEIVIFDTVGTDSFVKADYPWLRAVRVRVQGGGGGGGGCVATASNQATVASGGGGGGYAESLIDAASVASTVTVTVGNGGAGGAAGNNAGSQGGDSSFAALVVGNGGAGGAGGTAGTGNVFRGGAVGGGGVGDLVIDGGRGWDALSNAPLNLITMGIGGDSHLGNITDRKLAVGIGGGSAGVDADTFGVGGRGGHNANGQSAARVGGAGGQGIVIVELYA